MTYARDREQAAAIGKTEALAEVLKQQTAEVARERFDDEERSEWEAPLDEATYARVLGNFVMDLIANEQQNATQRGFAIHDENESALGRAVSRIRQGRVE